MIQRYDVSERLDKSDYGMVILHSDHLAALQRERECRAQLVVALESAKSWMNNGPQLRSECMAQIDAALAAAKELDL